MRYGKPSFSNRRLLKRVLLLAILLPLVTLSQVKIKEKVEVQPQVQTASRRGVTSTASSGRFFNPPFFVWDTAAHRPYLTLSANVTVEGSITFGADIGCGQYAKVYLGNYEIVGKGKTPAGWGCNAYDAPQPFVWDYSRASYPDVQMFVFDWQTADGVRAPMSGGENSISYSFSSYLRQGILPTSPPDVQVTAAATATGNYFLPPALLDHWEFSENQTVLTCNNSMAIRMVPIDGYGEPYGPVGISGYEAPVTVSLEGGGPYVILRALGQEGTLVATTLSDGCALVFDPTRGGFTGEPKVVTVTVTGGGKNGSFPVTLTCSRDLDHFLVTATPTVVSQGRYSKLTVIAQDANNQEVTFSEGQKFDVTLTLSSTSFFWMRWWGPPPYGSLVVGESDPQILSVQVPYDTARAGRVKYFVESDILTTAKVDSMIVAIRAEKVDDGSKNGSTEVNVKRTECVSVSVNPDTLAPGGTAAITLGTSGQYPTDQAYDVVIVGGGANGGTLVSPSGRGTELIGTMGPVQYIAPATIDSTMKIQVAALAYGRGGGYSESVQSSVISLSKKLPTVVATQSLSKKTSEARMVAIGRMLAENTCTLAEVVVVVEEVMPICSADPPAISTELIRMDNDPELCSLKEGEAPRAGRTIDKGISAEVEACMDLQINRWRVYIKQVSMRVHYGICEKNPAFTWINSAADARTEGEARLIVDDFKSQVRQIDSLRNFSVENDFPMAAAITHKQFLAKYAVLFHEEFHAMQNKQHLNDAVETVREELKTITFSKAEAKTAIEATARVRSLRLDRYVKREYLKIKSITQVEWDEVWARDINRDVLSVLMSDLKNSWNLK